jgi:hypothetical protein
MLYIVRKEEYEMLPFSCAVEAACRTILFMT